MSKQKDSIRYEVITQEDSETGDVILPIPLPLLKKLGWQEGAEIEFLKGENGEIILKRKD